MTRPPRAACALAAALTLTAAACGTTYLDTSATTAPTATSTSLASVTADTPLPVVLDELADRMMGLNELIFAGTDDGDGGLAELARIEELWTVAEAQIRARDPDDLFPFEQAITLARSGVERRRPADASKGYKLLKTAIEAEPES